MEKFLPKKGSYSKAKRLLVDRGVMSPLLLFVFFYVVAIMEVSAHSSWHATDAQLGRCGLATQTLTLVKMQLFNFPSHFITSTHHMTQ